ncbi:MAG: zinc-binding alcohol dehydrogenase, partial [Rhodospirillaceae bacterium]|nr:zinc-binding alcohol dehydrogenase [Rhodospirillaceae bacterium]
MKQVIQSRKSGKLALKQVPAPQVKAGCLLVETRASLISAGTERMVIDFAKKSLAGKARARPDLVKQVVDKVKRDGLKATFETVMARLDEPLPLGYSAAGVVRAVGAGLEGDFRVGERVAMAGAGQANHAEFNVVPRNLVAAIPDGVSNEDAAFGTLGAIAMHAVRNAEIGLGDVVGVIGCGLVGQLAAQFLALSGTRVIALDYNPERLELAKTLGAEQALDLTDGHVAGTVHEMTEGRGCDAIIIAAATSSNEPFETAAAIARDRARVVMVGMTGTDFPYADFMRKELNIIVSRSYGPGRYDEDFEKRG